CRSRWAGAARATGRSSSPPRFRPPPPRSTCTRRCSSPIPARRAASRPATRCACMCSDRRVAATLPLLLLLGCQAEPAHTPQRGESSVAVTGDLPRTGSLDRAALERLPQTEVTHEHDGVAHRYRGVLLDAVLRDFGFSEGRSQHEVPAAQKRSGW